MDTFIPPTKEDWDHYLNKSDYIELEATMPELPLTLS